MVNQRFINTERLWWELRFYKEKHTLSLPLQVDYAWSTRPEINKSNNNNNTDNNKQANMKNSTFSVAFSMRENWVKENYIVVVW